MYFLFYILRWLQRGNGWTTIGSFIVFALVGLLLANCMGAIK